MPDRVVVIGASMGGIAALRVLLKGLPGDFPVPVCIVLHTSPQGPGLLAEVLNPATKLDVVRARDEEPLEEGRVYVAPPDYHLLVERERLCVTKGPKENRFRPAIDPLFRSAAQAFGANAIGIVLTGLLDDGTSGLAAIKRMGGVAVVQDPADAPYPSMPRNALEHVDVDYSAPVVDIPPLLVELTRRPAPAAEEVAPPAELAERGSRPRVRPRQRPHPLPVPHRPCVLVRCAACRPQRERRKRLRCFSMPCQNTREPTIAAPAWRS